MSSATSSTTAPIAAGSPEKESSFARWKKKFTTKSKKHVEVNATPAAIALLNVSHISRDVLRRDLLVAFAQWRRRTQEDSQESRVSTTAANARSYSEPEHRRDAMGLAWQSVSSPLSRPRDSSNRGSIASSPYLGAGSGANAQRRSVMFADLPSAIQQHDSPAQIVPPSPSSSFQISPNLPPAIASPVTPLELPAAASAAANAAASTAGGSYTVQLPRRSITGGSADAASSKLSLTSPWTSARPIRPSIIHPARRLTATTNSASSPRHSDAVHPALTGSDAIHPSLLSPTRAFRKSLIVRDTTKNSLIVPNSNSSGPSISPVSPARVVLESVPSGDGDSTETEVPSGMSAHPRGSVMLGDLKEWKSSEDVNAEVNKGPDSSVANNLSPPPTSIPSVPLTPNTQAAAIRRRNSLTVRRWRGAVKQIIALAIWARKRASSKNAELIKQRLSVDVTTPDPIATTTSKPGELELYNPPTIHDDKSSANVKSEASTSSTTSVAPLTTYTPRSSLIDYIAWFSGVSSSALRDDARKEVQQLRDSLTTGSLVTKKMLDTKCTQLNARSFNDENPINQPDLLSRYPPVDHASFPFDPHWSAFGFPTHADMKLSVQKRRNICYESVMTLADGMPLFATYLKYDVAVIEDEEDDEDDAPGGSPAPQIRFWEEKPNGATSTPAPSIPVTPSPPASSVIFDPTASRRSPHTAMSPGGTHPSSLSRSDSSVALSASHVQLYQPMCMLLISHYPLFDIMRTTAKMIWNLACKERRGRKKNNTSPSSSSLVSHLHFLCHSLPSPIPQIYSIRFNIAHAQLTAYFSGIRSPIHSTLNLGLLFSVLNIDNILSILTSILTEARILFHSSSYHLLTYTTQSFLQLLHPFQWWYAYIPVLTEDMLDAHEIPQPYILGVHSSLLPKLQHLHDVLIIDIDHDVLRCTSALLSLPKKEGRDLWLEWRTAYERGVIMEMDRVEDGRGAGMRSMKSKYDDQFSTHTIPCSISLNNGATARRASLGASPQASSAPSSQHTTPSPPPSSVPTPTTLLPAALAGTPGSNRSNASTASSTMTHSSVPSSIPPPFDFTTAVYSSLLRFYLELLNGSSRFLFYIANCPFFNATGFVQQRIARDPSSLEFMKAFVASRAFDVYIEEESQGDAYHEFIGGASTNGSNNNKQIQAILEMDLGKTRKVMEVPNWFEEDADDGTKQKKKTKVIEVNVREVEQDEIIRAVEYDDDIEEEDDEATYSSSSFDPFSSLYESSSASSSLPLPALHWPDIETDLTLYNSTDLNYSHSVPRKPRQLNSTPSPSTDDLAGHAKGKKVEKHEKEATSANVSSQPAVNSAVASSSSSLAPPPHKRGVSRDTSPQAVASSAAFPTSASREHRLKQLLSEIFSSHVLSPENMREFTVILQQDATCRRIFATILVQPKIAHQQLSPGHARTSTASFSNNNVSTPHASSSHHHTASIASSSTSLCLTNTGFDQLATLIRVLLDQCLLARDYISASYGGLDIGNIYYREDNSNSNNKGIRVYMESALKTHPLWQVLDFWRGNLALALSQRAMNNTNSSNSSNVVSPSTSTIMPRSPSSLSNEDREFILSWMIGASHQMLANGVSHKKVEEFMQELCKTNQLPEESRQTIMSFLSKIKEAAQYW